MKLRDYPPDTWWTTALCMTVVAVLCRRHDGWCVYVKDVPGIDHKTEAHLVRAHGTKVKEPVARAIAENYFYPPFDIGDLEYAR